MHHGERENSKTRDLTDLKVFGTQISHYFRYQAAAAEREDHYRQIKALGCQSQLC